MILVIRERNRNKDQHLRLEQPFWWQSITGNPKEQSFGDIIKQRASQMRQPPLFLRWRRKHLEANAGVVVPFWLGEHLGHGLVRGEDGYRSKRSHCKSFFYRTFVALPRWTSLMVESASWCLFPLARIVLYMMPTWINWTLFGYTLIWVRDKFDRKFRISIQFLNR